jgi:NADH:ubiquinone oxidoreductase subunit 5 (subunit L)/multisubunit Na+/H+ antiporter MnhA subunit
VRPLYRALEAKWGFDIAYNAFARVVVVAGSDVVLWKRVDAQGIDGLVNGAGHAVNALSVAARGFQTGVVRAYALVVLGGAVALLGYLLWFR